MKPLTQTRDELAAENEEAHAHEASASMDFKNGWDAAVRTLAEGAGEFDANAHWDWLEYQRTVEKFEPSPQANARWQFEQDRARIGLYSQMVDNAQNKVLDMIGENERITARAEKAERELDAWKEIERLSECSRKEIYGMAYKLKPGKYSSPVPDIPTCSMVPASVKLHDDLCDILEARAFNEHDVCTASVGIWAAIGMCEKLFGAERSQLQAKLAAAEQALAFERETRKHFEQTAEKLEARVRELEAEREIILNAGRERK